MQNEQNQNHTNNHHPDNGQAQSPEPNNQSVAPVAQPSTTTPPVTEDSNRLLMGVLAYFGILVIIPYLVAKDDPFVKFHVKQGIVLAIGWLALWAVGMVTYILYPLIGVLNLVLVVFSIIGIINVVQKKEAELPLIGGFSKHINI